MEFDKYAESYDVGFMGRASARFYTDLIRELELKDGDSVLDVGCGTGSVLSYLSSARNISAHGLDVSEQMIAVACKKAPEIDFVVGDSGRLYYADGSMDVVMACMAYHHFPDQAAFRKETYRVLRPGGSLYICDPRFPLPVRWFFNTFFRDAGFRTVRRNISEFERAGFKAVRATKDLYVQVIRFEKVSGNEEE